MSRWIAWECIDCEEKWEGDESDSFCSKCNKDAKALDWWDE